MVLAFFIKNDGIQDLILVVARLLRILQDAVFLDIQLRQGLKLRRKL
jgi:hypothetical protein